MKPKNMVYKKTSYFFLINELFVASYAIHMGGTRRCS